MAQAGELSGQLSDRSTHPRKEMLDGAVNRDRDDREAGQNGNRVAMNGADQAVQAMPAEALAPVDVRLEHRERERGDEEERGQAQRQAREGKPRRFDEPPPLELDPFTYSHNRQPKDGSGEPRCEQRDGAERVRQMRAARPLLELHGELKLRRSKRVDDDTRRQNNRYRDQRPDRRTQLHD